ncbi:MAG: carbon-nitrogen family hydrolase [Deltaproteobacteria bacterium]|nr:carbon-nitrogen family hydrolase [Deltaproteobacteria bacterium]MBW1919370.1 carbon-nitrogen family hydrolase [Deltaproteobacteria bacterium]MBW2043865.1 carbon-nitrogen family hydrolase [Deltaproteobacteria bacterium]
MRVAAVQMNISWHDKEANYSKVSFLGAQAKKQNADLLVLPEMFSTGFSMEASVTSEPADGPTPTFLRSLAHDLEINVVGGFVLDQGPGGRPRNVSLAVDRSGRDLAIYAKNHLIALLGENKSYDPGDSVSPFEVDGMKGACFICYDLRFPELFRLVAEQCELVMVIASWPAVRQSHWELLLRARAIENQCFVVGVNRVGDGGGHSFSGGSAIIDPVGEILAYGGNQEMLVVADIDTSRVNEVRESMPFLKDRKVY